MKCYYKKRLKHHVLLAVLTAILVPIKHLQSLGVGEPFTNALTTDRFLSFQGSVCKVSTQDSEKFDEEVKSLVTAWH